MTLYQKFKKLKINQAAIGMEQREIDVTYFCTPKGARVIGWAGVDGIHYCFIRGFGEMVFAISPMNEHGNYVHPIAQNFEDLLRLLLTCGSMDAIEQTYMWNEAQFDRYVKENQPSEEQSAIMDVIKEKFSVIEMENPFDYIKTLQTNFDYSQIKFTPEYYDVEMNPAAEEQDLEWKVTYDGGFWRNKGRAGKEIMIDKTFYWGSERWYVPAIYICSKGLVIDFCLEAEPDALKGYIDKWDLLHEENNHYTKEQQEQMQSEHPLNAEFNPEVTLNGKILQNDHGYGTSWIPQSCLSGEFQNETEAKRVLEHYGLDLFRGWSVRRYSFSWATKRTPAIKSLKLKMERHPVDIPGIHFASPKVGDAITFTHPITNIEYTLTVHEYEAQQMEQRHFQDESMEYPTHYTAMTYTLYPDISGHNFMIRDYKKGDRPRLKKIRNGEFEPVSVSSVGVIGIIGGADGPTMILLSDGSSAKLRVACSSLHFEPKSEVEWYVSFREKLMEDIEVTLIG